VQDTLIAVVLTATALVGVVAHLRVELPEGAELITPRPVDALGVTLILLQTVPLALRRRTPVSILTVVAGAFLAYSLLDYRPSLAAFGFLMALYSVSAYRERRISVPFGIGIALQVLLILRFSNHAAEPDELIAGCLVLGSAWVLGDALRIRRGQVVQLEDRATRLEREREERAQQAVAVERRVIARELHDVVAHHVSVIVAQAGAAQRVFDTYPRESLDALAVIESTGREALVEMRRLTGFLRADTDRAANRSPQPGLANLHVLVDQVRDAGLPVTLAILGSPRPVPPGLDLSAFRIVQEALTNVLKHAGPARAEVVVHYRPGRLDLSVTDDGAGTDDPLARRRAGFGLLGMRERVALFGGQLVAGRRPEGGYRVEASLPLDGES